MIKQRSIEVKSFCHLLHYECLFFSNFCKENGRIHVHVHRVVIRKCKNGHFLHGAHDMTMTIVITKVASFPGTTESWYVFLLEIR